MKSTVRLLWVTLLFFIGCQLLTAQNQIKIASFNFGIFGITKAENKEAMDALAYIIRQFDIVAVQDIRDKSETAIMKLLNAVNQSGDHYSLIQSQRLGRSDSKEQYAFFCKDSSVRVLQSPRIWNDTSDQLEREPFMAMFATNEGDFDFILVNIHVKPKEAEREILMIPQIMEDGIEAYDDPDILCLGDYNADGEYFDEEELLGIFPEDRYIMIIPNDADTNLAPKSCAYDRMIASTAMQEDFTGEWGVFHFEGSPDFQSLGIEATEVSDHYPVWASFYIDR